jgi:hypothetical protein
MEHASLRSYNNKEVITPLLKLYGNTRNESFDQGLSRISFRRFLDSSFTPSMLEYFCLYFDTFFHRSLSLFFFAGKVIYTSFFCAFSIASLFNASGLCAFVVIVLYSPRLPVCFSNSLIPERSTASLPQPLKSL